MASGASEKSGRCTPRGIAGRRVSARLCSGFQDCAGGAVVGEAIAAQGVEADGGPGCWLSTVTWCESVSRAARRVWRRRLKVLLSAGDPPGEAQLAWHAEDPTRRIYGIDCAQLADAYDIEVLTTSPVPPACPSCAVGSHAGPLGTSQSSKPEVFSASIPWPVQGPARQGHRMVRRRHRVAPRATPVVPDDGSAGRVRA